MNSSTNMGTTFLQLLFIGLKLAGSIDWSWWWVMSPLWITAGIALMAFLSVALMGWLELRKITK